MLVDIFHNDPETNREHCFMTENAEVIAMAKINAEEVITESSLKWPGFGDSEADMALRLISADAVKDYADMANAELTVIN